MINLLHTHKKHSSSSIKKILKIHILSGDPFIPNYFNIIQKKVNIYLNNFCTNVIKDCQQFRFLANISNSMNKKN